MKFNDWVSFLSLIIALYILWAFRQILLLVFAAIVLSVALNSLVRRLVDKFEVSRGRAVLMALSIVVVGGILFISLVLPLFVQQFQELLRLIPIGLQQLVDWVNHTIENPPTWVPPNPNLNLVPNFSALLQQLGTLGSTAFGNFLNFFSSSAAILLQLLLTIVLTLMMLANPLAYRRLFVRLFPSWYRRRTDEILSGCESALLCWMGGVALNSLFVATLSFCGLLLFGIQYAFAHAMIAGLFNFIPNIGPALSAIFPLTVALLDSPSKVFAVIALYVFIQNLESYWFSPMMMQRQVALLPAATLIAQLFFAKFFGPLGLILALPMAVISKTWIEEAWIKDVLDNRDKQTAIAPGQTPTSFPEVAFAGKIGGTATRTSQVEESTETDRDRQPE